MSWKGCFFIDKNKKLPIRIAHIMGKMVNGGVESVIMNYYRNIDRTKIQFDFFVDKDGTCPQEEEIKALGGRVFWIEPYQNITQNMKDMKRLFKENKYKIVHSNLNTMSAFSLLTAKQCGIPVRICHNHSTTSPYDIKKNIMKMILRPFSKIFANYYFACSDYAGEWMFGKKNMRSHKVTVLKNAIDVKRFSFDPRVREKIRREIGVDNKFVIGHVGRFVWAKNHEFLIDVFSEVHKKRPESVLLLIGEGELEEKIRNKAKEKNIENAVIFLGAHSDIEKYYQAFDLFAFPSRFEGLGLVTIEAQISGTYVVSSEAVPKEAKITEHMQFIPLNDFDGWVNALSSVAPTKQLVDAEMIRKSGYDISEEAKKLENFYLKESGQ